MPDALTRGVTAQTVALVTTGETVVATLPIPSTGPNLSNVSLSGMVALLTGANTTGVTLRIRRASLTGPLVGVANPDLISAPAAAGNETHSIEVQDQLGDTAGQVYVLTAQQVGATGNGNVTQATLQATLSL
jgi:hypothetical protein